MQHADVTNLDQTGLPHDDRHDRLFEDVRRIYRKPVTITQRRGVNGMREYRDHLEIWVDPDGNNPLYSLAHELAHCISIPKNNAPTMPPGCPPEGSASRRLVGELLSLFDHPHAHAILADAGFADDVRAEATERSARFLKEIPTCADLSQKANSLMMALGFANMIATYSDATLLPQIELAMKNKQMETFAIGTILGGQAAARDSTVEERLANARDAAAMMCDDPRRAVQNHSDVFPETVYTP